MPRRERPVQVANLDIVFVGVEYICAEFVMRGVELELACAEEHARLQAALGRSLEVELLHLIAPAGKRFAVAASRCIVSENHWDIF